MTALAEPEVLPAEPATEMGTGPQRRLPPPPGARLGTVRRYWRLLTSMRTAIYLLLLLAVAAIPGSLIPQRRVEPESVLTFQKDHRTLGPILDRLQFFDVFASPWFSAIYLLLFISLIGCLAPRFKLHLKALAKKPPAPPKRFDRLTAWAAFPTEDADLVLVDARRHLRRRRYRVAIRGNGLGAERGALRETGNLLFHVSMVVVLIGIAVGSLFGYEGDRVLVSGQSFTNTPALLDQYRPGTDVGPADLQPFGITLDSFKATYQTSGAPNTFDAYVSWTSHPGATPQPYDLRVNHPLVIGAAKIYLLDHGYALHAVLRDSTGAVVGEDSPVCLKANSLTLLSNCVLKFDAGPTDAEGNRQQLAFKGVFAPDAVVDPITGVQSKSPLPVNPDVLLTAYVGPIVADDGTPQSVYTLDTTGLSVVGSQNVVINDPSTQTYANLPGGYSLTVDAAPQWASFQIKRDPAKPWVLGAAIMILLGLILSLRVRRRRVWVQVTDRPPTGSGGSAQPGLKWVTVGALARTESDEEGTTKTVASLVQQLQSRQLQSHEQLQSRHLQSRELQGAVQEQGDR